MHASQVALVHPRDKPFGASPTNLGSMHPTVTTHAESARRARALAPQGAAAEYSHPLCAEGRQLTVGRTPSFSDALGRLGHRSGVVVRDSLGHSVCWVGGYPRFFPAEYLDLYRLIVRDLLVVQSLFTRSYHEFHGR
jgi:hypothetical protein